MERAMEGWIALMDDLCASVAPASIVLGRFYVGRNAREPTEYMIVACKYRRANFELLPERPLKSMPKEEIPSSTKSGLFPCRFFRDD